MNMLMRVYLSIMRQKVKTLILLCSIALVGTSFVISIFVKSAVEQMNVHVSKEMNPILVMRRGKAPMTVEMKDRLSRLESVDYIEYNIVADLAISNLKTYKGTLPEKPGKEALLGSTFKNQTDFPSGVGNYQGTNLKETFLIKQNSGSLVEGRYFTQTEIDSGANVMIVSKKIADLNGYTVGQKVLSTHIEYERELFTHKPDANTKTLFSIDKEFEIVGIIDINEAEIPLLKTPIEFTEEEQQLKAESEKVTFQNTLHVPNKSLHNLQTEVEQKINELPLSNEAKKEQIGVDKNKIVPIVGLKDAQYMLKFIDEATSVVPERTQFISDYQKVEPLVKKMKMFDGIANMFFGISLCLTIFVLILLLILFMRDRKTEIGVLFALGEKKYTIGFQVMIETVIITLIGITISLGNGLLLTHYFSNEIAKTQSVEVQKNRGESSVEELNQWLPIKLKEFDGSNAMRSVQYTILSRDIVTIYVVILGSATIASVVPTIYVLRLKPKTILR